MYRQEISKSGAEVLLGPLSITRLKQLIRERIEAGGIIGTRSRVSSQCCRAANHLVHRGERIAAEGIGIFTWGKPACKRLHLVASLLEQISLRSLLLYRWCRRFKILRDDFDEPFFLACCCPIGEQCPNLAAIFCQCLSKTLHISHDGCFICLVRL